MRCYLLSLLTILACHTAHAADAPTVHVADGELHYTGSMDKEANQRLFALYESLERKPVALVVKSKGGEVNSGIELGQWVHAHRLDVRVPEYCLSSCANYVFTAGARKIVSQNAVIGYHGGISSSEFALDEATQAMFDKMSKEQQDAFWAQVRKSAQPAVAKEAAFFTQIGVDQTITTYGQASRFEHLGGEGWTYTKEGFAHFGVKGIEVTGGRWEPAIKGGAIYFSTIAVD